MVPQAEKVPPLPVCPKCGNRDMDDMNLIVIDLDWVRYSFMQVDEGIPSFTWSKSIYSETSNDHDPRIECNARISPEGEPYRSCDGEWDIEWGHFDIM